MIHEMRLETLQCLVDEPRRPCTVNVILCHGYGAPGDDLAGLAGEFRRTIGTDADHSTRFIFPAALVDLSNEGVLDGRAWWPLNIARLQQLVVTGELKNLRSDTPPGLPEASDALLACVGEVRNRWGGEAQRLIVGGFSQGAMIATEIALRLAAEGQPADGLILFSGSLIAEDRWRAYAASLEGVPVVQSHGRADPILPFAAAAWLHDFFTIREAEVDFFPFAGGHTIPREAVAAAAKLIAQISG